MRMNEICVLRFLLTIFSFYVLLLSVHPCEDSNPVIISEITTSVTDYVVVYEHVVKEQDICPPFCLCTCCSISLEMPYVHLFPILNNDHMSTFIEWIRHNVDQPTFDIFQPPRLASVNA